MKRAGAIGGAVILLLLTAGCGGGMSKDEQAAAKSIGATFAGDKPSDARKKVGSCVGDTLVDEAGLSQLKKDKVIDAKLKASSTVPQKLSEKTAQAYADAIVKCFDFSKLKDDIGKQTGANKAQVNAYVTCLGKIDSDDLRQAIVDQYTKSKPTDATKKVNAETTACGKKLGT